MKRYAWLVSVLLVSALGWLARPNGRDPREVPGSPAPARKAVARVNQVAPAVDTTGEAGVAARTEPTNEIEDKAFETDEGKNLLGEREQAEYHRRRVDHSPDSAEAHFEFAEFLFTRGELGEADRELSLALGLEPNLARAAELRAAIDKVAALPPDQRGLAALSAVLAPQKLDAPEIFAVPGKTVEESRKDAQEANRERERALKVQYAPFDRYEPSTEESLRAHLIFRYGIDKDWDAAVSQFDRLTSEYPGSPYPFYQYADALVHGSRLGEASSVVERAKAIFPKDARLCVLEDLLAEVRAGRQEPGFLWSELRYRLGLLDLR
jgi:tetratricopeptide (TPR) repeat protein